MVSRRTGFQVLIAAMACLLALPAAAQSHARIVRLSYLEGDVQFDRRDGRGFDRAFMNMPVVAGARVWARNGGRVEVEFEDGSTLRLTPDTLVNFRDLSLSAGGDKITLIELEEGTAYFDLRRSHQDDIRVQFAGKELVPGKHARLRIMVEKGGAELAVFQGDLQVLSGHDQLEVRKNETLRFDQEDQQGYFLAKGVSPLGEDDWDKQREDYRDQYSRSNSYNGYSSSYRYGLADLNYYGSYFSLPGYGMMWRPFGTGFDWDPFADGAWVWYPGYGYTWISSNPWGWMPYHYGYWTFVNNYGWCWQPGRTWNNWQPISVIGNGPTGYVGPKPPANTGGGTIVVGRGPERPQRPSRGSAPANGFTGSPAGPGQVSFDRGTRAQRGAGHDADSDGFSNRGSARVLRGTGGSPAGTASGSTGAAVSAPRVQPPAPAPGPQRQSRPPRNNFVPSSSGSGFAPHLSPPAIRSAPAFSAPAMAAPRAGGFSAGHTAGQTGGHGGHR